MNKQIEPTNHAEKAYLEREKEGAVPEELPNPQFKQSTKLSLDDTLEQARKEEEPKQSPDEEDTSITLMIFTNTRKSNPKHPDVNVMLPTNNKKWKQVGVGWNKTGARGTFTVLKLDNISFADVRIN